VLGFERDFARSRNAIGIHAFAPLEALPFVGPIAFLSSVHYLTHSIPLGCSASGSSASIYTGMTSCTNAGRQLRAVRLLFTLL
jgi:hypothetical protein